MFVCSFVNTVPVRKGCLLVMLLFKVDKCLGSESRQLCANSDPTAIKVHFLFELVAGM